MYFNDTHIAYYIIAGILGLLIGQFIDWCNKRLPEYKKVFTLEILKEYKKELKPNYILMITNSLVYIFLVHKFGIQNTIISNIELIKYIVLTPMLLSVVVIDYKLQIIPNRLNLTIFEIGLIFTFIYGIYNINIAVTMLLGSLLGAGIFLLITLIGGLIAGKEAMGFGDVKLMGALGLFFGLPNMIVISLLSFLIGAILSVILIATKVKKTSEYIPFGPFIVIGCFIIMFVPFNFIVGILLKIFTLGMLK